MSSACVGALHSALQCDMDRGLNRCADWMVKSLGRLFTSNSAMGSFVGTLSAWVDAMEYLDRSLGAQHVALADG